MTCKGLDIKSVETVMPMLGSVGTFQGKMSLQKVTEGGS